MLLSSNEINDSKNITSFPQSMHKSTDTCLVIFASENSERHTINKGYHNDIARLRREKGRPQPIQGLSTNVKFWITTYGTVVKITLFSCTSIYKPQSLRKACAQWISDENFTLLHTKHTKELKQNKKTRTEQTRSSEKMTDRKQTRNYFIKRKDFL